MRLKFKFVSTRIFQTRNPNIINNKQIIGVPIVLCIYLPYVIRTMTRIATRVIIS